MKCPNCRDETLNPVVLPGSPVIELDHCGRCGGTWFDAGEVKEVRGREQALVLELLEGSLDVWFLRCPECSAAIDADARRCGRCGWLVSLPCPRCESPLVREEAEGLTLDYCPSCRGAWFDAHEIARVWTIAFQRDLEAHGADPSIAPAFYEVTTFSGAVSDETVRTVFGRRERRIRAVKRFLSIEPGSTGELAEVGFHAFMSSPDPSRAALGVVEMAIGAAWIVAKNVVEVLKGLAYDD
jgi:Zn-finger nucleic acid-binding protein